MSDLISRKWLVRCVEEGWIKVDTEKDENRFIHLVRDIAPSAQPYTEADIQKIQELEQAELQKAYECGRASAQPEIIRCKECKHHSHDAEYGYDWCNRTSGVFRVKPEDFCSRAERRTDEQIRGFEL